MKRNKFFLIFLIFSFATANAQNQKNKPSTRSSMTKSAAAVKKDSRQSINFDDELVEGDAQKSEFLYVFQKKNPNFARLIKLRENFIPEMRRSAEDVQRLKGGR